MSDLLVASTAASKPTVERSSGASSPKSASSGSASTPASTPSSTAAGDRDGAAPSSGSSSGGSGGPSGGQVSESVIVSLSEAALALQRRTTEDRQQQDDEEAVGTLSRAADQAGEMADSIQGALDDLKEAFEKLARLFGLSDEEAEAGGRAVRAAAEDSLRDRDAGADGAMTVTRETRLVLKVEELSVSYTREGPDGTTSVTASVRSVSLEVSETVTVGVGTRRQEDPLVLDLDGNGIDLTPAEDGESFDIDGDGKKDRTAWVAGNDAFLAMDRDGDGAITSGKELFGDQNGAKDGFAELAKLDENGDGTLDDQDSGWPALLLLHADGTTRSLEDAGITSIALDAIVPMNRREDDAGNVVAESGFTRQDGSRGTVGEVFLDVLA